MSEISATESVHSLVGDPEVLAQFAFEKCRTFVAGWQDMAFDDFACTAISFVGTVLFSHD